MAKAGPPHVSLRAIYPRMVTVIASLLLLACSDHTIIYAERKNLIESVYTSGKIIAEDEHIIYVLNNGLVSKKLIRDGDTVKKGQLLYIIEKELPTLKVQSGKKASNMLTSGDISLVVTSGSSAKEKQNIYSDCDGVIYQSNKEEGEAVRAAEPLVLIGRNTDLLARMAVDQLDISRIKAGQPVLLKTDLSGDTIYEATVKKVYPLMNETNQSFRVDVSFNTQPGLPFLHNSAEGNIIIQKKENALVLPVYALLDGDSVQIKTNGSRKTIKITTGIKGLDYVEVLAGIDEKVPVVIQPKK